MPSRDLRQRTGLLGMSDEYALGLFLLPLLSKHQKRLLFRFMSQPLQAQERLTEKRESGGKEREGKQAWKDGGRERRREREGKSVPLGH